MTVTTGRQHIMMWVAMGKAMAATIAAKAVTAMAEATDAAVRAVVKAVAVRGVVSCFGRAAVPTVVVRSGGEARGPQGGRR